MSRKIYVGKLSSITTDENLFQHFSQAGKVITAKVAKSINPDKNAGYGYITMSNDQETKKAIKTLNNTHLEGNNISVMEAHLLDQESYRPYNQKNYKYRNKYRK